MRFGQRARRELLEKVSWLGVVIALAIAVLAGFAIGAAYYYHIGYQAAMSEGGEGLTIPAPGENDFGAWCATDGGDVMMQYALQYGALGILLVALVLAFRIGMPVVQRFIDELRESRAERQKLLDDRLLERDRILKDHREERDLWLKAMQDIREALTALTARINGGPR